MDDLTIQAATFADLETLVRLRVDLQRHLLSCNPRLWRTTDNEERRNELGQEIVDMLGDVDQPLLLQFGQHFLDVLESLRCSCFRSQLENAAGNG